MGLRDALNLLVLSALVSACDVDSVPVPKPVLSSEITPDVVPPACPVEQIGDGYWVPTIEVRKESCDCYRIRARLNDEVGVSCDD